MRNAFPRRVTAMLLAGMMSLGQMPYNVLAAEETAVAESVVEESTTTESEAVAEESVETEAAESAEENTESEAAEVTEEAAGSEETEVAEEAAEETADTSAYDDIDFSAQRLLVGEQVGDEEGTVLGEYDSVALIQYDSEEETKAAYAAYVESGISVDVDDTISVADDSYAQDEMTEAENPIAVLNDIVDDAETDTENSHPLIALIDTGLNDSYVDRVSVIGDDASDNNGHGDLMASYILNQDEDAQILSIKALDENGRGTISTLYAAMEYAIESGAEIINLSVSARASAENSVLGDIIQEAVDKGIEVVGAAGNNGKDAKDYVPGGIEAATILGAATADGEKQAKSNYGETVDYYVVASSTSEAAATYTGLVSSGKEFTLDGDVIYAAEEETEAVEDDYSEFPLFGSGDTWETMYDFTAQSTMNSTTTYTDGYSSSVIVEKWNEDGVYLDSVSGEDILAELRANATSYLGRPYELKYYDTATDSNGAYNCDGFVDHVLMAAGGKRITYLTGGGTGQKGGVGWHAEIEGNSGSNHSGEKVKFTTIYASSEADLMKALQDTSVSGLQPGSVIWFWDASVVSKNKRLDNSGTPASTSDYHHIGFYIGNELDDVLYDSDGNPISSAVEVAKGDSNKFFHAGSDPDDTHSEVHVTNLTGKVTTYVATVYPSTPPTGDLYLEKVSSDTSLTNGNPVYSLAGAVYGVYSDADCTTEVDTLTTDADGKSETIRLAAPGTYYIKEKTAPSGYELDTEVHTVSVESGKTTTFTASDVPGNDPISILLKKKDAATGEETAQGDGSLAGAQFTVKYYATHSTSDPAASGMEPMYTWVFETKTDSYGNTRITFSDDFKVGGDNLLTDSDTGLAYVPYGTITVEETKAPAGYKLNSTVYVADLTANSGSTVSFANLTDGEVPETAIYGGIEVTKVDAETDTSAAQGKATLAGAEFTIYNASENAVTVNGTSYEVGDAVMTITTDASGKAATGANDLPYGTYTIKETKAPTGYKRNTTWNATVEIREDGKLVTTDTEGASLTVKESPVRADLKFTKVDDEDVAMPNIPFLITNIETGESHVIVSDNAGVVDTTASRDNINANDAAIKENGKGGYTVDESKLDAAAGIWFGEESAAEEGVGSLLSGSYRIEELQVSGIAPVGTNAGYNLKSAVIVVSEDGKIYNVGTDSWINRIPLIQTLALTTEDNNKVIPATESIDLQDTVIYNHLTEGREYEVEGTIVLADDTTTVVATTTAAFTATTDEEDDEDQGSLVLTYEDVNTLELAGKSLVCTVALYDRGNLIQVHADTSDENQMVRIPAISTTAKSEELDEAAITNADGSYKDVTITDTVAYENLWTEEELALIDENLEKFGSDYDSSADKTFVIRGILMDKETGEPLVNADGEEYVSWSEPFTSEGNGTQDVVFTVNAEDFIEDGETTLEGKTVVVFETLYRADSEETADDEDIVATHEDIDDEEQDIRFPKGRTHATDNTTDRAALTEEQVAALDADHADETSTTAHEAEASTTMEILDRVTYENLHAETEYTVTGTLQVVTERDEDGNAIAWEAATDDDGNVITAEATFTTEASESDSVSGEVDVLFTFSGVSLAGKTLVAFETIEREGQTVIVHADINDEAQTIDVPSLHTNAYDAVTGIKQGLAEKGYIIDEVTYENLEKGKTYTISGTEMDKETGEAVSETVKGTFVAGVDNQFVSVDGTVISTVDEVRAAIAKELSGEIKAEETAESTAEDAESATENAESAAESAESTEEAADSSEETADSSKEAADSSAAEEPTASEETEVTADGTRVSGTVYVVIPMDTTELDGHSTVAFEKLFATDVNGNDKEVGNHEDIDDADQTVTYPSVKTVATVDGKHTAKTASKTTLVDTVSFTGLTIGEEYTVTGVLMDKATGKELTVNGKTVTASTTFVPDATEGSTEVKFEFDTSALNGTTVVAFEELTVKAGTEDVTVGEHKDINDEDQSVTFSTTGTSGKSTSDTNDLMVYGALIAILAALAAGFYIASRKKRTK